MGDKRRFNEFSKTIAKYIPDCKIADVAGGKGYNRAALADLGYKNVETWDRRFRHLPGKQKYSLFDYKTAPHYEAVIGMHPDEASDHIILYAAKHGVPAAICPCCTKPSATTYWGMNKYKFWVEHLLGLAKEKKMKVRHESMKFNGKNDFFLISP